MFGDANVTENVALASQAKARLESMRRKSQAEEFRVGRIGNGPVDFDRARAARPVPAAVHRTSDDRVEREAGAQQHNA